VQHHRQRVGDDLQRVLAAKVALQRTGDGQAHERSGWAVCAATAACATDVMIDVLWPHLQVLGDSRRPRGRVVVHRLRVFFDVPLDGVIGKLQQPQQKQRQQRRQQRQ